MPAGPIHTEPKKLKKKKKKKNFTMKASVVTLLLAGLVAAQDFTGQPDCAVS